MFAVTSSRKMSDSGTPFSVSACTNWATSRAFCKAWVPATSDEPVMVTRKSARSAATSVLWLT